MLIRVDLAGMEKHLLILEQEMIQERRNTEMLAQWRQTTSIDPNADLTLIDRQICFMEQQIQNTLKKKIFLAEMVELLSRTNYHMGEKVASAENALRQLE